MEPIFNAPLAAVGNVACPTWDTAVDGDASQISRPRDAVRTSSKIIINLPERLTATETHELLADLKRELAVDQPCIVLDMSEVKEVDTAGMDLLLECLLQTVRRDGNIELRGVSPEAATVMELTGMDRILGISQEISEERAKDEVGRMGALTEPQRSEQRVA